MKRSFAGFAMVCCVCESLAVTQSRAESESPRRLFTLTVAATDAKGNPVLDLRRADVRIRDDGTPLSVVSSRSSRSGDAGAPAGTGEVINRPAAPPTLILLDPGSGLEDLHTWRFSQIAATIIRDGCEDLGSI